MTTITDQTQSDRLTRARVHLLLDFPWFGSLAMRIKIVESTDSAWCPTFQVDGTSMWYNPSFSAGLSDAELVGVMAHEIMHCAMLHPFRRNGRDGQDGMSRVTTRSTACSSRAGLRFPVMRYWIRSTTA